jgi:hypothetical protein
VLRCSIYAAAGPFESADDVVRRQRRQPPARHPAMSTLHSIYQGCRRGIAFPGSAAVDCPGQELDGVCLRVQEVEAGQAVLLESVNFSSVDTKVRLAERATGTTVREVDAHVCGDGETPLTEIVKEEIMGEQRVGRTFSREASVSGPFRERILMATRLVGVAPGSRRPSA